MDESLMIWIASKAISNNWDYEKLKYGDEMYGNENLTDEVWEYVKEGKEIGERKFNEKYKHIKLF